MTAAAVPRATAATGSGAAEAATHGRRRHLAPGRRVLLAACLLVILPVAVAVLREAAGGWVPSGDDAWMARRTMQVATAHPPLLGQESTASDVPTSDGLSHPGPVAYYVMAVPYGLTGWSPIGLLLAAGLVVAGSMVAVVLLVASVAGDRGALAVAVGLALVSSHLGMLWLVHPASSVLVVMPLLAASVGAWTYAWGRRRGLLAALGFGSFALQTSLVVLPLAALVLVTVGVIAAVRWVRTGQRPVEGRGWWVVGLVAVSWVPPLIDQATRRPGNLADLVHYLWSEALGRPRDGKASTSMGLRPALGTVLDVVTNPFGAGGRALRPEGIEAVTPGQLTLGAVALFVLLGLAAATWSWRRGGREGRIVASLAGTAAVLTLMAVFTLSRRPTDATLTPSYYVLWIEGIAALWWTAIALALVDAASVAATRWWPASGQRGSLSFGGELAIGLVVGLVVYASIDPHTDPTSARDRTLSTGIRAALGPETIAIRPQGLGPLFTAKGVGADLIAHGWDARFDEWGGMVDERARLLGPEQASLVFVEGPGVATSDVPGLVARYGSGGEATAVWYVPGGRYARFCQSVLALRLEADGGAAASLPRFATGARDWPEADAELAGHLDVGGPAVLNQLARGQADAPATPAEAERAADVTAGLALYERECGVPER